MLKKKEHFQRFISLLIEAYMFYFKDAPRNSQVAIEWFDSKNLWWEMGIDLMNTPFLLLAEDALWESFLVQEVLFVVS